MINLKTKWVWIFVGLMVLAGGGWLMRKGKVLGTVFELPGEAVADQGREHWGRAELEKFVYNSNPPTSGPHDPDWIRPGVYDSPQDKYKLIHSLEHGYVVISYNCQAPSPKSQTSIFSVRAHEDEGDLDNDEVSSPSASPIPSCELGDQLKSFVEKLGLKRVIVNPNLEINKRIVIVAWERILKMDSFDEELAEKFVRAFHNKGPEQTME